MVRILLSEEGLVYVEQTGVDRREHVLQDYVMERLQRIEGVSVAAPDGAFYVLPDLSAFFGNGVRADSFGPIPDADTLCRLPPCPRCCCTTRW